MFPLLKSRDGSVSSDSAVSMKTIPEPGYSHGRSTQIGGNGLIAAILRNARQIRRWQPISRAGESAPCVFVARGEWHSQGGLAVPLNCRRGMGGRATTFLAGGVGRLAGPSMPEGEGLMVRMGRFVRDLGTISLPRVTF